MTRYPEPLKKGDLIGITAPSSGVTGIFESKMNNAEKHLKELGYRLTETESVRKQHKLTSAGAEVRAAEFRSLYMNPDIKAILPPWGGDFLMDMLPHLDLDELNEAPPKWIMGFSDISALLFILTINTDIATAHGPNLIDFGNTPLDNCLIKSLNTLQHKPGDHFTQHSFETYQEEWPEMSDENFPPYNLVKKVKWKSLNGNNSKTECSGRVIGGNLDIICKLIGTPFCNPEPYISRHEKDGVIWYFESCEMYSADIYRTLWQMKKNNWFKNCSGILYGRPKGYYDADDFTLTDAFEFTFSDLNIPVIYDIDLGHLPPQFVFVNGAYATVTEENGKGSVEQRFI